MTPRHHVRARVGISMFFFVNGSMYASLLPRLPEVKDSYDLGNGQFGVLVAMGAFGSMIVSSLPAPLIRRFGAQAVSLIGTFAIALALLLAGFAPWVGLFAAALFLAGFSDGAVDAAQNVHAVRVEDAYGRTIINSLHALWSLGATAGGAVGAWLASMHVALGWHMVGTAIVGSLLAVLATWLGRLPATPVSGDEVAGTPPTRLPKGAWALLAPLAILSIAGVIVEDVASNWAALYLIQVVGVPLGIGGLGYAVMIGSQFVGRLLGDPATDRWGTVTVIRAGGALIALGGLLIVAFPSLPVVMVGYALAGYGCATVVPAAYAAAGRLPGMPEGAGITLVSWLLRVGFLLTSPIVGGLSELAGLRIALGILFLSGLAVAWLAIATRSADEATEEVIPPTHAG